MKTSSKLNYLALLLCLLGLISCSKQAEPQNTYLDYTIIDNADNIISEGKINIAEAQTVKRDMPPWVKQKYFEDKFVKIYENFIIKINNYGYQDKFNVKGFGLTFEKNDQPTFSWEWYDQKAPHNFIKRQGKGTLTVSYRDRDKVVEISEIKFHGTHILRCDNKDKNTKEQTSGWKCIIRDGSQISL